MESRAGGLVRLRGSVGARPEGQSGAGLPVPVCHRVGLSRRLADVNGQSAGGSDGVDGLPDTWSERGVTKGNKKAADHGGGLYARQPQGGSDGGDCRFSYKYKMCIFAP